MTGTAGTRQDSRPIVVGVSRSTGAVAALRWAAEEAVYRRAPLHAVMAWRRPLMPGAPGGRPPAAPSTGAEIASGAEARLASIVRDVLGSLDGVSLFAQHGSAISVLLAAAKNAQLIVIGPPRLSDPKTLAAGLLAPQLVYRSPCPVTVVPPESAGGQGGVPADDGVE
jgi:nucleotide-binding universal stress UspA family protein